MNIPATPLVSTLAIAFILAAPNSLAHDAEKAETAPLASSTIAKDDDTKKPFNPISKWGPAPTFKSEDGRFQMKLRGRIFLDAGWVNDKNDSLNLNATEFRTARLGIEGKAWTNVKYKFEADFAGDEITVKDAYMTVVTDAVSINIGQLKTANSLEEQTSSRYITLTERASFTDAFGLARRIGISAKTGGDNWTVTAGVFRGDNASDSQDEGMEAAARVTYGPKMGDLQLHFGASTRVRKAGDDQAGFRYRQRPHNHLSDRFVNTNSLGKKDTLFGAEFAAISGPLSVQAEYATLTNDMETAGIDNPSFQGGYAEVSYFITGGYRKYDAKKGTFGRNKVTDPFGDGGAGAWQITARYDGIDLSDPLTAGGVQKTAIIGVNWYLNPYMRIMANYASAKVTAGYNVAANDILGENTINSFGLRAQIDW